MLWGVLATVSLLLLAGWLVDRKGLSRSAGSEAAASRRRVAAQADQYRLMRRGG